MVLNLFFLLTILVTIPFLIYRLLFKAWLIIFSILMFSFSAQAVDFSYMIRAALKTKQDYKTFMTKVGNDEPIRIVLKNSSGTTIGDYSVKAGGPYVDQLRSGGYVNSSPVDWGSLPEGENSLNDLDGSELKVFSYVTPEGGRAFFHYTYTMPAEGSLPSQVGIADPLNPGDAYTNASDYGGNGPWYKNYGSRLYVVYSVTQSGTNSVGTPIWQIKYRDYYKGTGYGAFTADEAGNLSAVEPDSYPELIEKADNILSDFDGEISSTPEDVDFEIEIDTSTFEGDGYYDTDGNLIEAPENDVKENEDNGDVVSDNERNDNWFFETPGGTQKTNAETALLQDILKKLGDIEEGIYSSGGSSSSDQMPSSSTGWGEFDYTKYVDQELFDKDFTQIYEGHYNLWLETDFMKSLEVPSLNWGGTLPRIDLDFNFYGTNSSCSVDFEPMRGFIEKLGTVFFICSCLAGIRIIFG